VRKVNQVEAEFLFPFSLPLELFQNERRYSRVFARQIFAVLKPFGAKTWRRVLREVGGTKFLAHCRRNLVEIVRGRIVRRHRQKVVKRTATITQLNRISYTIFSQTFARVSRENFNQFLIVTIEYVAHIRLILGLSNQIGYFFIFHIFIFYL